MKLIVTGTSSGIGRALTERLLHSGHSVWGIARSDQSAFAAAHPGRFWASACDVSQWSSVERTVGEIRATWSHADGLVTCAGIQGEIARTVTADPEAWCRTVRANLEGTFHAIRGFYSLLTYPAESSGDTKAPSHRAKIVCFSGGGANRPRVNFSAYGVAKTGIVRLVETIAAEEKERSLDINAIAPGAINTRLTEEVLARGSSVVGETEYRAALEQKRTGGQSLDKALGLVEWLLSPASDGISGRMISAQWDPWESLAHDKEKLAGSDIYTLRRILPNHDGKNSK